MFLSANRLAELLKIDRATVSRRIKKGKIKAQRDSTSGYWRIPLAAYEEIMKKNESR